MPKFHDLAIAAVGPAADNAVSVTFNVPEDLRDEYRFVQGQHLNVRTEINGEPLRRSYSICNAAGEDGLSIAIRRVESGLFSTYANEQLKPGDVLQVMTPTGRFFTELYPDNRNTYVTFAAGAGITPIISNIKTILASEPHSRVFLFYGNRSRATTIFREALMDLKNRYMTRFNIHFIFSREQTDMDLFDGHIDGDKAAALMQAFCPAEQVDIALVCGPDSMIEDVSAALQSLGVPAQRIQSEQFGLRREPRPAATAPAQPTAIDGCRVTVVMDAQRTEFVAARGTTLLEAAHRQAIELPFSCKAAVCATCRTKLIEGDVDMAANFALEAWELEAGYILACQSRPMTDTVVIDYDQT